MAWHSITKLEVVICHTICILHSALSTVTPQPLQLTNNNIQLAVTAWLANTTAATALYGPIQQWKLSKVTNVDSLFEKATLFQEDLSAWDTSQVTRMDDLFYQAKSYNNGNRSLTWDTSKMTSLEFTFSNAHAFNQDVSTWNVSQVILWHTSALRSVLEASPRSSLLFVHSSTRARKVKCVALKIRRARPQGMVRGNVCQRRRTWCAVAAEILVG